VLSFTLSYIELLSLLGCAGWVKGKNVISRPMGNPKAASYICLVVCSIWCHVSDKDGVIKKTCITK
jgi:hypothetical protein